jgi:hypothetical protein
MAAQTFQPTSLRRRWKYLSTAVAGLLLGSVLTPAMATAASGAGAGMTQVAALSVTSGVRLGISAAAREYGNPNRTRLTVAAVTGDGKAGQGTVQIRENGRNVAIVRTDAAGLGQFLLSATLAVGFHRFYAVFIPSSSSVRGSSSTLVNLTVVRTRSTLAISLAPRFSLGTGGWGSVTVSSIGFTPTGAIGVYKGGTLVYRTVLSGGRARFLISPSTPLGRNDFKVAYYGNWLTLGSSAGRATIVTKRMSSVSLSANSTSAAFRVNGTLWVPTGNVTVSIDGRTVSTKGLSSGSGGLSYARLAPGTHTISASYPGDAHFSASSATVSVEVAATRSPCSVYARACVDLTNNKTWIQEGGRVIYGPVPMLSGRSGYRTDPGTFAVYWKDIDHKSSIFDDAPMPYAIFFDGGTAFHEGSLSIQSHGCIHLSYAAANYFWYALDYGDTVHVFGHSPY